VAQSLRNQPDCEYGQAEHLATVRCMSTSNTRRAILMTNVEDGAGSHRFVVDVQEQPRAEYLLTFRQAANWLTVDRDVKGYAGVRCQVRRLSIKYPDSTSTCSVPEAWVR
jgi:hypothetical protein